MAAYELIGMPLGHSMSKQVHEALGAYRYHLRELPNEQAVAEYLRKRQFKGCNVTIPYKQTVMPLCDFVDERAARIGAVNTIVNQNGLLHGYNTDYDGLRQLLAAKSIILEDRMMLVLGTGGTRKTACAVAQDANAAEVLVVSRHPQPGQISYEQAAQRKDVQIIINTTPVGMYPNNGEVSIDIAVFPALEGVVDVIYNPLKTILVLQSEQRGLPACGGLGMLVGQAVRAAELFTQRSFGPEETRRVLRQTTEGMANLVLVGMPGSGKSQIGRAVANKLGKPFADLDAVLEKQAGRTIADIFAKDGEETFRKLEAETLAAEAKKGGRVIATGGGIVTQPKNLYCLRQNGPVVYLKRPVEHLQLGGGRPLSQSRGAVQALFETRAPLYEAAADIIIENDAPFIQVVHRVVEAANEYFGA
jgi:shikimate dehydrogenase